METDLIVPPASGNSIGWTSTLTTPSSFMSSFSATTEKVLKGMTVSLRHPGVLAQRRAGQTGDRGGMLDRVPPPA